MMKMEDINKLDEQAILKKIEDIRVEIFNAKFQKHTSGIEKPHTLKNNKKNIARLKTALNQKKNNK